MHDYLIILWFNYYEKFILIQRDSWILRGRLRRGYRFSIGDRGFGVLVRRIRWILRLLVVFVLWFFVIFRLFNSIDNRVEKIPDPAIQCIQMFISFIIYIQVVVQ